MNRFKRPAIVAAIASMLLCIGCQSNRASTPGAHAPVEANPIGTLDRAHASGDVIFAGQPTSADLQQLHEDEGIVTVINMRHAREFDDFDESLVVTTLGMTYENPAWSGPDELTDALIDDTRQLLRTAARPMLVHCASANRVGAMWMAYRVLDEGLDIEAAAAEAKTIGLRSAAYEQKIRDYIARQK